MRREKSLERFLSTWKFTSAKAQRVLKYLLEEDEELRRMSSEIEWLELRNITIIVSETREGV